MMVSESADKCLQCHKERHGIVCEEVMPAVSLEEVEFCEEEYTFFCPEKRSTLPRVLSPSNTTDYILTC